MTWLIFVCGMTAHGQESRKLAVVVGVNTYRANSDLPSLTHAVADASKLSAVLRTAGFTVIEMTHEIAKQDGKVVYAPNLDYIRDQISGVLDFPNLGANDAILITLHGHVLEWCQDDYDEDAYRKAGPLVSDPLVTGDGRFRVLRSGDWMDFASDSRSARRYNDKPDKRSFITGFRISMTP